MRGRVKTTITFSDVALQIHQSAIFKPYLFNIHKTFHNLTFHYSVQFLWLCKWVWVKKTLTLSDVALHFTPAQFSKPTHKTFHNLFHYSVQFLWLCNWVDRWYITSSSSTYIVGVCEMTMEKTRYRLMFLFAPNV